jgi:hypothetical protein
MTIYVSRDEKVFYLGVGGGESIENHLEYIWVIIGTAVIIILLFLLAVKLLRIRS